MTSVIPHFDLCTTADSGFMLVLICDDGTQIELPPHSAAELLLAAAEIDLTTYTDAVRHLRETHPLFEEKLDISVLEYRDFLSQALELPEQLRRTFTSASGLTLNRICGIQELIEPISP